MVRYSCNLKNAIKGTIKQNDLLAERAQRLGRVTVFSWEAGFLGAGTKGSETGALGGGWEEEEAGGSEG